MARYRQRRYIRNYGRLPAGWLLLRAEMGSEIHRGKDLRRRDEIRLAILRYEPKRAK